MTLSIAAMGLATAYWQVVGLALLSGVGNSVIHPSDYAILSGSVDRAKLGRSFAFHTFVGHIGFAALDVFDVEPLPDGHHFYQLDNFLLSPHSADHVVGWADSAMNQFIENYERYRSGQPLENLVDKKAGY